MMVDEQGEGLAPFAMIALNERPTPSERSLIYQWGEKRDACLRRVADFVRTTPAPQRLQTFWSGVALLTDSNRVNIDSLVMLLAGGRMTYGQFNTGRTQIDNITSHGIQTQFEGMRTMEAAQRVPAGSFGNSDDLIGQALGEAIANVLFRPDRHRRR